MLNSKMISYAKHEEEFYGVLKLINGEEVLGKAVLTNEGTETLCFIQNPVAVQMVERDVEGNRLARGIGFSKWMQLSNEDFYVIREKDIICVSTMSKQIKLLYQAFVMAEGGDPIDSKTSGYRIDPDKTMGLIGNIDDYRSLFEKIYKTKNNP